MKMEEFFRRNFLRINVQSLLIVWWFFVLIFNDTGPDGGGGGGVDAKVCGEVDARNDPSSLEVLRGCHIITGSLSIVLIEKNNATYDIRKVSFPELR